MKRPVLLFLIFLLAGWVFVPAAHAQINYAPSADDMGATVDTKANAGQMSKEVYTVNTQVLYANTGTCLIVGCSSDQTSPLYYGKSAVAMTGNLIAGMYDTPPADLALWIHDTAQTLGFEPKRAYAQGIGFSGFSGLLPLWQAFRNIAYALLAIVMIVIGFMVMFRKKIDPKTVVTVQNALPKIVLTLLLITFSYAIVGLMIDLMYVAIYLLIGLFQSSNLLPAPTLPASLLHSTSQSLYAQGGILVNITNLFGISSPLRLVYQALGIDPAAGAIVSVGALIFGLAFAAPTGGLSLLAAIPAGLSAILSLLISIALLFLVIRLFIFFLSSYIQIVLALLFAPLQLVFEAVPGSTAFSSWLKNLFANLIVFPIGAGAFMLSAVFMNIANGPNAQLWNPPLTTLVPSSTRSLGALVGLGILFIIPNVAGSIKESLKAKPALPIGVGAVTAPLGQAGGIGFQAYQFYHSIQQTEALKKLGNKNPPTEQNS
jgi:hypothetical protein